MAKRKSNVLTDGIPAREEQSRRKKSTTVVEETNALSFDVFKERYWISEDEQDTMTKPHFAMDVELFFAADMGAELLEKCLKLVETTSRQDYEKSSWGWHVSRKRKEMKEKEMRYVILWQRPIHRIQRSTMLGFMSFMLTHDSTPAVPVLYVYEIHLAQYLRGKGLGYALMNVAQGVARAVGVEKVMLTCFLSNTAALEFYRNLGFEKDVCSPEDRRTRNKTVKTDYMIMSKEVGKVNKVAPESRTRPVPDNNITQTSRNPPPAQAQCQIEVSQVKVKQEAPERTPLLVTSDNIPQVSRALPLSQPRHQTNPLPTARPHSLTIPAALKNCPAMLDTLHTGLSRENMASKALTATVAALRTFVSDPKLTDDAPLAVCRRGLTHQLAFLQNFAAGAEALSRTLKLQTAAMEGAIKNVDHVIRNQERAEAVAVKEMQARRREEADREREREKARQEKTRFKADELLDRWFKTTVEAGAFSDLVKHEHIEEDIVSGAIRDGVIKVEPTEE